MIKICVFTPCCCTLVAVVCQTFIIVNQFSAYRVHTGDVVGLTYSPDGEFMYSADSEGSLAFHNASEESHSLIRVMRKCTCTNMQNKIVILTCFTCQFHICWFCCASDGSGNVVARGSERAPDALALSSDSTRLAFVGPTEYVVTIADTRTLDEVSRSREVA